MRHSKSSTSFANGIAGVTLGTLLVQSLMVHLIHQNELQLTPTQSVLALFSGSVIIGVLIYKLTILRRRNEAANSQAAPQHDRHEPDNVLKDLRETWGLSAAETEVAVFAVKGFSNKEISELRGSEVATVKKQLSSVYRKTGLENRFQLISHVNEELLMGKPQTGQFA